MTSSTADSSSGAGSSRSRVGKVINHGSESKLHQLIPTTKLIRKSRNLYVIFSCRLGSTHSKIDDLFIYPPPQYSFRFISLVGYLYLILGSKLPSLPFLACVLKYLYFWFRLRVILNLALNLLCPCWQNSRILVWNHHLELTTIFSTYSIPG